MPSTLCNAGLGGRTDEATRYKLEVWDLDEYVAAFTSLPESQQKRVSDLYNNHLPNQPHKMMPPMLKRLKGQQSHLRQFTCGNWRLHYTIDDEAMLVTIVDLGKHKEWEKRGKVGG